MDEIDFNINDYIKVKLTQRGTEILRQNHNRIFGQVDLLDKRPFQEPSIDEDGYCKFQMWQFCEEFGGIGMGEFNQNPPHETNIKICIPSEAAGDS